MRFTFYKNSILATIIDLIGSGFGAMAALCIVAAVLRAVNTPSLFQNIQISEVIGGIIGVAVLFLIGMGLKILAEKIAAKKAEKNKRIK